MVSFFSQRRGNHPSTDNPQPDLNKLPEPAVEKPDGDRPQLYVAGDILDEPAGGAPRR